jgi:hypothetical protein
LKGGRVRERGRARSWQDCFGSHPSLVSTSYMTKRIREGERDGRLGLPLDRVCKEREEKKRRKEKFGRNSFEI